MLLQEELLWLQKSRNDWLKHSDNNTRFFHTSTLVRRRRNKVGFLIDDSGQRVENAEHLKILDLNFYKDLFTEDPNAGGDFLKGCFPTLGTGTKQRLGARFTLEETRNALKMMGSLKALGPDGFHPIFFKETWESTGTALHGFAQKILESGEIPSEAAEILVVLIPKEEHPTNIRSFRPISLCNVTMKVVARMVVSRLKEILGDGISSMQVAFVPGRQSCDNYIICQEVVHSLRFTSAKSVGMIVKLDLEKAYNRLEWRFIEETLLDADIPVRLVQVILNMLRSSSCKLLWNGESMESFKPTRGLRQGDPLSLYIFVLCMQRLSSWIQREVSLRRWRPLKAARGGEVVSHLLFADDILLFTEATVDQVDCILDGLNKFCKASGHKINTGKSSVFFSPNIAEDAAQNLSAKLGIKQSADLGVYLEQNVQHQGHSNRANSRLLERVRGRLDGWKSKTLSLAGRLTLAKSVINSMGVFQMQVQRLPTYAHKKLDSYVKSCVWGDSEHSKKTHLLSWETLCKPKENGGFGMKRAADMNKALLAKLCWRMMT